MTCAARICALTLDLGMITALQKAALCLDIRLLFMYDIFLSFSTSPVMEYWSEEALMRRS